jgi:hypothetical protein
MWTYWDRDGEPRSDQGRRRHQVLQRLKLELVTAQALAPDEDERSRGSDPYNSQLGVAPADVWKERPKA